MSAPPVNSITTTPAQVCHSGRNPTTGTTRKSDLEVKPSHCFWDIFMIITLIVRVMKLCIFIFIFFFTILNILIYLRRAGKLMLWIGSTFSFVFPISEKFPEVTTEIEPTMTEVLFIFLEKSCEDNHVDERMYKRKNDALSIMLLSLFRKGSGICKISFLSQFLFKLLVLILIYWLKNCHLWWKLT